MKVIAKDRYRMSIYSRWITYQVKLKKVSCVHNSLSSSKLTSVMSMF